MVGNIQAARLVLIRSKASFTLGLSALAFRNWPTVDHRAHEPNTIVLNAIFSNNGREGVIRMEVIMKWAERKSARQELKRISKNIYCNLTKIKNGTISQRACFFQSDFRETRKLISFYPHAQIPMPKEYVKTRHAGFDDSQQLFILLVLSPLLTRGEPVC